GAKLVESGEDIHEELGRPGAFPADQPVRGTKSDTPKRVDPGAEDTDPITMQVLEALGYDPVHIDTLQLKTKLDLSTLSSKLLQLELSEFVARQDDGRYLRR